MHAYVHHEIGRAAT